MLVASIILSGLSTTLASENPEIFFRIPAQRADLALTEFAAQAGITLVFPFEEVSQRNANRLDDMYTLEQGLIYLLKGTDLTAIVESSGGVSIAVVEKQGAEQMQKSRGWLAGIAVFLAGTANAQVSEVPDAAQVADALEEIIVTARKREENLQDIPISVSVFSGDALRNNAITNLEELTAITPNVYVAESFVGDALFIRGVGSGQNNMGVEQAVGQVIDGVFYGRSRMSRLSYLDIERVEILRGPQGALIGKNTTAGAINITTARPTDSFEAWITTSYEMLSSEGATVEGAVSGPLTDTLSARAAVRYDNRDGYLHNTELDESQVGVEDLYGRFTLLWEPNDNVDATLTYQYADIEHHGENSQYSTCELDAFQTPPVGNLTRILIGGTSEDCTANYNRAGAAPRNGGPDQSGKTTNLDTLALVVNWDTSIGTVTSVTGWAEYDFQEIMDSDRSVREVLSVDFFEDYKQWSQELRLVSNAGGQFDYIIGLYYLDKEQSTGHNIDFRAFSARRNSLTREDATTFAVFGEVTWHISEQWSATLGARYTDEKKDGRSQGFPSVIYTSTPTNVPPFLPAGLPTIHDVTDQINEDDFSPSFALEWRPSEGVMYYVSYRRGFKAGAFNHALVGNQADATAAFAVGPESVDAFELGTKITFLDGRARFNAAVFSSKFDGLQVAVLNPATIINDVVNAAKSTSEGVELELRWRPVNNLTLFGSVAYLNSTFDSFSNATCYSLQPATECVNGSQDLSGKPSQFAPDWSATFESQYVWNLSGGYQLDAMLRTYYSDDFFLQVDLDPKLVQDDYWKFDASLSLSSPNNRWVLALIGRNLSDKLTANYGDDVPVQAGSVWKSVEPPRSLALQATLRF